MNNFILDLIKFKYTVQADSNNNKYYTILASPATGILYVTENSPQFISGHVRMRGRDGGSYSYRYLETIDHIFGKEENTIEVCSGSVRGRNVTSIASVATMEKSKSSLSSIAQLSSFQSSSCFTVDINPDTKPDCVADGQNLDGIPNGVFNRWRCDPP